VPEGGADDELEAAGVEAWRGGEQGAELAG
jgi:hypothetical protein